MAEGGITYNINDAKRLGNDFSEAYNALVSTVGDQWGEISRTLQAEWVGEDEQSFETEFAKKLNELLKAANETTKTTIDYIGEMINDWVLFQRERNMLKNAAAVAATTSFSGDLDVAVQAPEEITVTLSQLDDDTDRGLVNGTSSATTIREAITSYVNSIKSKGEEFSSIDIGRAFQGEQQQSVKTYVEKIGNILVEITIAVDDMFKAVDQLANQAYAGGTGQESRISEAFTGTADKAEASLDDLKSRWTGQS